jgi:hypothetical protein
MKRKSKVGGSANELKLCNQQEFYQRIKMICSKMVGSGIFEKIPIRTLRRLDMHRYLPIEIGIHCHDHREIKKEDVVYYKKVFYSYLSYHNIETLSGQKISFRSFVTDVLSLIHYVQFRISGRFRGSARIYSAFTPYFTNGDWYEKYKEKALKVFGSVNAHLTDITKYIITSNVGYTALISPWEGNVIHVYKSKSQSSTVEIEGRRRPVFSRPRMVNAISTANRF